MKEIITIQISKFLTNDYVKQIGLKQWGVQTPATVNRSRHYIFDEIFNDNECFGVIATNSNDEIVGRLHCIRNEENTELWYYGDLFVSPNFRRMGIASKMIMSAVNYLSEIGAQTFRCYVEPGNAASIELQRKLGFLEKPFEKFNYLINDGEIMFEKQIPNNLSIIPATVEEAYFVRILFSNNKKQFSGQNITLDDWKEILSRHEEDKRHFLVCKGAVPIAYIQIGELNSECKGKLTMFFVANQFDNQEFKKFVSEFLYQYGINNSN